MVTSSGIHDNAHFVLFGTCHLWMYLHFILDCTASHHPRVIDFNLHDQTSLKHLHKGPTCHPETEHLGSNQSTGKSNKIELNHYYLLKLHNKMNNYSQSMGDKHWRRISSQLGLIIS
uniref:Uncharacterized protein n=1 Tax=Trichobilharzia regenti TaxID=157069 RepID=A0AA85IWX3_TRIRE|nr:unnamed protein product [Trichobilharzia regenti]